MNQDIKEFTLSPYYHIWAVYGRKSLTGNKFFSVMEIYSGWRIMPAVYQDSAIYLSREVAIKKLDEYLLRDGYHFVSKDEFEKLKLLI